MSTGGGDEIGRMIISLMGDNTNYRTILQQAIQETQQGAQQINQAMAQQEAGQRALSAAIANQTTIEREARAEQEALTHLYRESNAVVRQNETAMQGLERELERLTDLYAHGGISLETYNQAMQRAAHSQGFLVSSTGVLVNRTQALAAAERMETQATREALAADQALTAAYQRGTQVMRAHEDAVERYGREVQDLSELLIVGAINQQTFDRAVAASAARLAPAIVNYQQIGSEIQRVGFALTIAGGLLTGFTGAILKGSIDIAGMFEQNRIAMTTLLGSVIEGRKIVDELVQFAARSPFELQGVIDAARTLTVFGERGQFMMETLRALGNAAAATSSDFALITLVYNQIKGAGQLLMQDFRQLATRGVLSLQDLANHFGKSTAEIMKMQEAGEITYEDVRAILIKLSEAGGRFANAMLNQSKSFVGQMKILYTNVKLLAEAFGSDLLPAVKGLISIATTVVQWLQGLSSETRSVILVGVLLTAGLGATVTAFGVTAVAVGQLVMAYGALTAAAGRATTANSALAGSLGLVSSAAQGGVISGIAAKLLAIGSAGSAAASALATVAPLAAIAAAIAAIPVLIGYIHMWIAGETQLAEVLKNTNDQLTRQNEAIAERSNEIADRIRGMESPIQRQEAAGFETSKIQKEVELLRGKIAGAMVVARQADTIWAGLRSTFGATTELEIANTEVAKLQERLQSLLTAQQEIDEAARTGPVSEVDPELLASLDELTEKLKEEIALFGLEGAAAEIQKLRNMGLADSYLVEAEALAANIEQKKAAAKEAEDEIKRQEKLDKSVKSYTQSVQDSIRASQLEAQGVKAVSDVLKLEQMVREGITDTQRTQLETLIKEKQALEEAKEARKEHDKELERGKKIVDEFLSPLEKYTAKIADLRKLRDVLGPSFEQTFQRATTAAEEEFRKAGMESDELKNKIAALKAEFGDNEAVRKGSKEMRELLGNIGANKLEEDARAAIDAQIQAERDRPAREAAEAKAMAEKRVASARAEGRRANPEDLRIAYPQGGGAALRGFNTQWQATDVPQKMLQTLERISASNQAIADKEGLFVEPLGFTA